jgi:flagellum-specific ATP synthase
MPDIASEEHKNFTSLARDLLATYKDSEDLINIGAYVKGSNKKVDLAITYHEAIEKFLKQGVNEQMSFNDALLELKNIFK